MHHTFSILLYLDCIQEKYTQLSCNRFWSNNRFDIPNRRVYSYRLYLYIVSCPLYTYISTWRMPEPFFFSLGNDIFCKVWEEPLKPDSVSTSSWLAYYHASLSQFKIKRSILILSFFLEKHLEGRSSYKSSFFGFCFLDCWFGKILIINCLWTRNILAVDWLVLYVQEEWGVSWSFYSYIVIFIRDLWSLGFRIMLIWVQRIMPKRVSDQLVC